MAKKKLTQFVFIGFLFSASSQAAELPIEIHSKSDLNQEAQKLSLDQEILLPSSERATKDLLSFGLTKSSRDTISIKTPDQTTQYDLAFGLFASYRSPFKEFKMGALNISGQAAYHRAEQSDMPIKAALHVLPITAKAEFTFNRKAIEPNLGIGVRGIYLSQQGAQAVKSTELDSLWLLSAGFTIATPWDWKLKLEAEQNNNIDTNRNWSGTNWNAGIAIPL
jgi:outer membrane protein W